MSFVSAQSRKLRPLSSAYFTEESGETKILVGLSRLALINVFSYAYRMCSLSKILVGLYRLDAPPTLIESNECVLILMECALLCFRMWSLISRLDAPKTLEISGLEPRINSPGFSLIAWVKLSPETGGVLIEKLVGSAPESRALPCWQWHVGAPADRFSYGAHDFGGETGMFWNVSAGVSKSADGKLHMVAVVVNQSSVSFYTDATLNKEVPIVNPVTDWGS